MVILSLELDHSPVRCWTHVFWSLCIALLALLTDPLSYFKQQGQLGNITRLKIASACHSDQLALFMLNDQLALKNGPPTKCIFRYDYVPKNQSRTGTTGFMSVFILIVIKPICSI